MDAKTRKNLISAASKFKPIFSIGKSGITEILITEIGKALSARELVKIEINKNSLIELKTAAEEISAKTSSEIVRVIGRKIVIYRKKEKNDE
ncbi:YhbY family RNA-binding protein [candidate division WOR-3 bacterium]|nr:YhbY family RNA-binding protein [candidate division WOR-3 bacterium]